VIWYLVIRRDVQPRGAWTATLDQHLAWMREQHLAGRVLFSGPTADIRTGIYLVRSASRAEAERIAASDPFTAAGHCAFDLYEWDVRQALGAGPFSTAELDASNKTWRPGWEAPKPSGASPLPEVSADWTPGRMAFQLGAAFERYVLEHSSGYSPAAARLFDATVALGEPAAMMLAKEQYALLRFLAGLLGCRRALDVGTFTGLSAMAFAEGMGPGGRITTIDRNRAWIEIARRHWDAAGVTDRIDVRTGEALDVLQHLASAPGERFDIAFLDVDKARVRDYFELTLPLLAPRALLVVDNTLWHGWVMDSARSDADTDGMRRFNDSVAADPRVEAAVLPVGDGMTLIRRSE
jgi:caffeoyl-CoA O-methyltransferase